MMTVYDVIRRSICQECCEKKLPGYWSKGYLQPLYGKGICSICKQKRTLKILLSIREPELKSA